MKSDFNPSEYVTIPEGWSCKTLVECTIDGNISYGIVQPGQHDENGIPVIRINNINNGQLNLSNVLKVSLEIEQKYKRTRLKGGEVLLTLVGSTGQSFVAPKELAGWNVPRAIAVIRANEEVGADWINICLQSTETMHFLNIRANTTVQKTLNLKEVRDIPILIPPKNVKDSIENLALSLSDKIELNRQTNQTLEQIAQALFKSWFVDFDPVKAKIAAKQAGGNAEQIERAAMAAISGKTEPELNQLTPE
ncbi:MAG: restriction endonuclease subunit S, partial [Thiomicrospira sp.]|uniref:restriction endonuclease subunit S n=1 Tax=Thiomicrospira sp. TaxID=935 RepID=UPI0019E42FA3